jgi:N-carbamoyl-L-amino-acid hydrolase
VSLRVNGGRLAADLAELGTFGRAPGGGINRTSFSAADLQARQWYLARCAAAGLTVRIDGIGNMVVSQPGDTGGPAVWSGSHLDAVPDGGAFDGAVGAIAALECVRRLAEEGIALSRPVRAVAFTDEEGNYSHLLGSSAMARGFPAAQWQQLTGRDGDRLVDAITAAGWDVSALTATKIDPAEVYAFVELHIEQGPRLAASRTDIGAVTSIVGLGGAVAEFGGRADHAGTTPMDARRDPLLAAADLIAALPGIARSVSEHAVATCGRVDAAPGAANVVPGEVAVTLDYRDPDAAALALLGKRIAARCAAAAAVRDVSVDWQPDQQIEPVALDPRVISVIEASARRLELSVRRMPSGAGHDAQNMATLAPAAMIFVPSRDGRSHSPAEHTEAADVENGANVLLATLTELATQGLT